MKKGTKLFLAQWYQNFYLVGLPWLAGAYFSSRWTQYNSLLAASIFTVIELIIILIISAVCAKMCK